MKRFRFTLERIRRYRKLQMENEQAALEGLQSRLQGLHHSEAEIDRRKTEAQQSLVRKGTVEGVELGDLGGLIAYSQHMKKLFALQRTQIENDLSAQRRKLMEARQKFEMLDRLRDRSRERWQRVADLEQEQTASESYLAKWGRR